jgi:hypothetical protein
MSYRTQIQGLLAEKKLKLKELVTRANALVTNLHMQCSPYVPIETLVVDQIRAQAEDLEKHVLAIRELNREICALQKELGADRDG